MDVSSQEWMGRHAQGGVRVRVRVGVGVRVRATELTRWQSLPWSTFFLRSTKYLVQVPTNTGGFMYLSFLLPLSSNAFWPLMSWIGKGFRTVQLRGMHLSLSNSSPAPQIFKALQTSNQAWRLKAHRGMINDFRGNNGADRQARSYT